MTHFTFLLICFFSSADPVRNTLFFSLGMPLSFLVTQGLLLGNIVICFVGITRSTHNVIYFDVVDTWWSSRLMFDPGTTPMGCSQNILVGPQCLMGSMFVLFLSLSLLALPQGCRLGQDGWSYDQQIQAEGGGVTYRLQELDHNTYLESFAYVWHRWHIGDSLLVLYSWNSVKVPKYEGRGIQSDGIQFVYCFGWQISGLINICTWVDVNNCVK